MEAQAEEQTRSDQEEGVCLPRAELRASRPCTSPRRLNGDQETLLEEARREEMEVREVLEALCRPIRLESSFQDMRHP